MKPKETQQATVQGRGNPVPVQEGGGQAGSSGPSASDCDFFSVGNQAERSTKTTGLETENPFSRRDSICRTPPRERAFSMPEVRTQGQRQNRDDSAVEMPLKRKRGENTPENVGDVEPKNQGSAFQSHLEKMFIQIEALEKLLKGAYKPKKEVCDISSKLSFFMERLRTKEHNTWLEEAANKIKGNEDQELRRENESLRKQLEDAKHNDPTKNTAVKCEKCKEVQALFLRRCELKKEESYENFQSVTEDDWENEVFANIKPSPGRIWDAPTEWNILLPCSKNYETTYKEVGKAIEKFGGIPGLLSQNKKEGEIAMMSHSLGFPDHDGNFRENTRWIYYPIISDRTPNSDSDDKHVFHSLATVKEHMLKHAKTRLAIPEMDDSTGVVITRMIKFLFADSPIQVQMYSPDQGKDKALLVHEPRNRAQATHLHEDKRRPR